MAAAGDEDLPEITSKLKCLNVNCVQLVLWPQITTDGRMIEYWESTNYPNPPTADQIAAVSDQTESVLVKAVQKWHRKGFRVFLLTYHERLGDHHAYARGFKGDFGDFLNRAKEIAVKWARIAEQNKVELYAPRKELQLWCGPRKSQEWDLDILSEVRKEYKGKLVLGIPFLYIWDRLNSEVYEQEPVLMEIPGYDYLGVDFYGSDVDTFDELRAFYARFLIRIQELRSQLGVLGVVYEELGIPHHGNEAFWNDPMLSADNIMTRIYDIFFGMSAGRIFGFCPWIWDNKIYDLPGNRKESVDPTLILNRYYSSITAPVSSLENIAAPVAKQAPLDFRTGRILFFDEFNTNAQWNLSPEAQIAQGVLEIVGEGHASLLDEATVNWRDYVFSGRFKPLDGELGIQIRNDDRAEANYAIMIKPAAELHLLKSQDQQITVLRGVFPLVEFNKWHTFSIYARGGVLVVFIDGDRVADYNDKNPLRWGNISFHVRGQALFDDIKVEELEL